MTPAPDATLAFYHAGIHILLFSEAKEVPCVGLRSSEAGALEKGGRAVPRSIAVEHG